MAAWLDQVKSMAGLGQEEQEQEQTLIGQIRSATTLDRSSRMIGFAGEPRTLPGAATPAPTCRPPAPPATRWPTQRSLPPLRDGVYTMVLAY